MVAPFVNDGVARSWFALTALAEVVALGLQIGVTARYEGGRFATVAGRIFNLFCYFTVQSNVLVGFTCLGLALRLHRSSSVFRALRLAALVDIALTGVVYHLALAHPTELTGHALVADQLLHTVAPIMAVLGWLLFGTRRQTSATTVRWALVVPLGWVIFTFIRGPIVDYYPYPFIDVSDLGYPRVLGNVVLIALLFFALALGATSLDRRHAGLAPPTGAP